MVVAMGNTLESNYQIIRELAPGVGWNGNIFLVKTTSGSLEVIKVTHDKTRSGLTEYEIASRIQGEGVIQVHGTRSCTHDDIVHFKSRTKDLKPKGSCHVYSMEKLEGTLDDLVSDHTGMPMDTASLASILIEYICVLQGLWTSHGFRHGDIQLVNIGYKYNTLPRTYKLPLNTSVGSVSITVDYTIQPIVFDLGSSSLGTDADPELVAPSEVKDFNQWISILTKLSSANISKEASKMCIALRDELNDMLYPPSTGRASVPVNDVYPLLLASDSLKHHVLRMISPV